MCLIHKSGLIAWIGERNNQLKDFILQIKEVNMKAVEHLNTN